VFVARKGNQLTIQPLPTPPAPDQYKGTGPFDLSKPASARAFLQLLDSVVTSQAQPDSRREADLNLIARTLNENKAGFDRPTQDLANQTLRAIQNAVRNQSGGSQPLSPELRELLTQLERRLNQSPATKQTVISLPQTVTQGFMQFTDLDEALEWLTQTLGRDVRTALPQSDTSGPAVVRTSLSELGVPQAVLLDTEQAGVEIEHFLQQELKSPLWKLLSAESLLQILQSKGTIATERLATIDQYLMANLSSLPQLTERPPAEVRPLLQQWLSVILDSDTPLAALSTRAPLNPAADIALLYGKLAESITSRYGLSDVASAEDYLLNARTLDSSMARSAIIPAMVERLGLTTEQLLASTAPGEPVPDTLKTQLYSLLHRIEQQGAEMPPRPTAPIPGTVTSASSGQPLQPLPGAGIASLETMSRPLDQIQALLTATDLGQKLDNLTTGAPIRTAMETLRADLQTLLGENREKIAQLLRVGQLRPEMLPEALGRARELLNRLADQLRQAVDTGNRQIQQVLSQSESLLGGDGRSAGQREVLNALRGELEQFTRNLSREIAALSERSTATAESLLAAPVKQQVETILQRIETLQVLAKPTPVADGQQQILVLPLKIDNEWSEVNVQLIKKREKSAKKKGSRDYAVQIQVAPSFCGPVAVQMEYSAAGGLGVRINSEKGPTNAFFEANRPVISAALIKLGFKSVNLTAGTFSPDLSATPAQGMTADPVSDPSANIDIRV
jgi:hypothetical protein